MATVLGNDNNNWLAGTSGADTIKGYGGNDTLKGGGGADYLYGGTGIDTALYNDSPWGVVVDLESGRGNAGDAYGDRLFGIENVWGSAYDDWLYGDNGANQLTGADGDDYLSGRFGADLLDGGYGNDRLDGGAGADMLSGGAGTDTGSYYWSTAPVNISLATGMAWGGHADGDVISSIENLVGSAFDDMLYGDGGANILEGDLGNDMLDGGGAADVLTGYYGNDRLYGRDGDDLLQAGDGEDRLDGGRGLDRMAGGYGGDTFVWSSADETGVTISTSDFVMDFNAGEGDRLDLSGVDANVYAAGDQAFTFIGMTAFSGTPGEINYYHLNGDTYVQMQTGTSADVEGVIRIYGIVTPEASWFVL